MSRTPGRIEVAGSQGRLRLLSLRCRHLQSEYLDPFPRPLVMGHQPAEGPVALEGVCRSPLRGRQVRVGLNRRDPGRMRRHEGREGGLRFLEVSLGKVGVGRGELKRRRRSPFPALPLESPRHSGGVAPAERRDGRLERLRVTRGELRRGCTGARIAVREGAVGRPGQARRGRRHTRASARERGEKREGEGGGLRGRPSSAPGGGGWVGQAAPGRQGAGAGFGTGAAGAAGLATGVGLTEAIACL